MKTADDMLNQKNRKMISVPAESTINDALQVMIENNIGSILIKQDDKIVGIWTERDLMRNTIDPEFDSKTAVISDYMVTGLQSAANTDTIYDLMDKFLGKRLRHLLIEKDGNYVGLLSIGDVIKANLVEKTEELKALNTMVSWEYYENWRWK